MLILVYSMVLFLKTLGLIVIGEIVFLKEICWFKFELRAFYDFTLRNIAVYIYIYITNEKCLF